MGTSVRWKGLAREICQKKTGRNGGRKSRRAGNGILGKVGGSFAQGKSVAVVGKKHIW